MFGSRDRKDDVVSCIACILRTTSGNEEKSFSSLVLSLALQTYRAVAGTRKVIQAECTSSLTVVNAPIFRNLRNFETEEDTPEKHGIK